MVLERHAHIRVRGRGLVLGCDNHQTPSAVRKDTERTVECRNPMRLCSASWCGPVLGCDNHRRTAMVQDARKRLMLQHK